MSLADTLFPEGQLPKSRDELLRQGFTRDYAKSKEALPDPRLWPLEFDELEQNGSIRIDRRLLFSVAERAASTPDDAWSAAQLHTGVALWGAHPGRDTQRRLKPLSLSEAPERLTKALQVVRGEGAISGYKSLLRPRGRLYIPGLGPSFFTQFLYFGGWDAKPLLAQPLIMSDYVIAGLAKLTRKSWTDSSADDYIRYLDLARDIALEREISEDQVEAGLWALGGGTDAQSAGT